MTRVLVLSDLWPPFPGGAERLMFNLARHLERSGMEVFVVTGYENAQAFDGPPIRQLDVPVHEHRDEGAVVLAKAIADVGPDVIVAHHLWAFQFERLLSDCGVPLVQVVLNGHRIAAAALAVFISEYVRGQAEAQPQDLTVTPPAFPDPDIVDPIGAGTAIGFVKPIPHKGVDLVYQIAQRLRDRRFVILRGEWQTLEDIRPMPNVEFMEPVERMAEFYARCRLVLVPSLSEDAGTVAQEATLNRLPCLSSNVGGLAETNAGGVLLNPTDVRRWVQAIRWLDNPTTYARVVRRQREHLDLDAQADRLDRFAQAVAEAAS